MRATTRKALCAAVCLLLIPTVIWSALEVKYDKVEYMPPKVEGQKKGAEPIKGHLIFDKEKKTVEFQDTKGQPVLRSRMTRSKACFTKRLRVPGTPKQF